ncbi:hypothetical protein FG386_003454 [Cryptosporidium ryanae]|uniref:uncharacterized protein n=1 Tax=Cryptosporidium ryanae TaxID=515981 RepID=UPI00351A06D0|nr:hypothetical protein FG386_003454 [Cryptosporidium ryanae]
MKRCKTGDLSCKDCFTRNFEEEIHEYIQKNRLFEKGSRVGVCISGGKDSSVLLHVMYTLNRRKEYGLDLELIAIDEGIIGYRDDSLEVVKFQQKHYNLPLTVLSFRDLYGTSMDDIQGVSNRSNSCTYCGVFRRKALDIGSDKVKADIICTGHNCDDACETVLLNLLRGDYNRFKRCTSPTTKNKITESDEKIETQIGDDHVAFDIKPRVKPLMYSPEKEIVLYAHYLGLKYFSTECKYSVDAYRGVTREFIRRLQNFDYKYSFNLLLAAEELNLSSSHTNPNYVAKRCKVCGYISSSDICNGCNLIAALKNNDPGIILKNQRQKKKIVIEQ